MDRVNFLIGSIVAIIVVAVFAIMVVKVSEKITSERKVTEPACVQAGGVWYNDSCLFSRK